MKTNNPDRVPASEIPEGWRLMTLKERDSLRRRRIRIWEPVGQFEESPSPHWGPVISVCHKPRDCTVICHE